MTLIEFQSVDPQLLEKKKGNSATLFPFFVHPFHILRPKRIRERLALMLRPNS